MHDLSHGIAGAAGAAAACLAHELIEILRCRDPINLLFLQISLQPDKAVNGHQIFILVQQLHRGAQNGVPALIAHIFDLPAALRDRSSLPGRFLIGSQFLFIGQAFLIDRRREKPQLPVKFLQGPVADRRGRPDLDLDRFQERKMVGHRGQCSALQVLPEADVLIMGLFLGDPCLAEFQQGKLAPL